MLKALASMMVAISWTGITWAAVPVAPATVITPPAPLRHELRVGATVIPYVVSWSAVTLSYAGAPQATISATTYLRDDVREHGPRPVLFAFNGGPGASSSPLHFGLLGPRRQLEADATGKRVFVDNAETLLDVADLVMIDPVGTGFSRELCAGCGKRYWSPAGDADATQAFIRTWLRDHGRQSSPLFLVGESYGGFRLAQLAKDIGDLNVQGLILVSPGTDLTGLAGKDQSCIDDLPSMAVAAFAHGKGQAGVRDVAEAFNRARAFAQGPYAVALQQGSALDAVERDRIAALAAEFIGLPAKTIADANLRVGSQDFLEQLLPGQVVGRIDTRVAAPKPPAPLVAGRAREADDPALNMGASNVKKSPSIRDYLRTEAGVQTDLDYVSLTLDVNFAWNWNSGSPKIEDNLGFNATPYLATLMKARPTSRLLLLSGYYDLATPVLSQQYALTHAGIPLERTTMRVYPGAHAMYGDDASRSRVSADLHAFIAAARGP